MLGRLSNNRDYKVFLSVINSLIKKALATLIKDKSLKKFGTTKMIDSTTISMCLTFFDWAEFRSTKAGIKMHTRKEYEYDRYNSSFATCCK